MVSIGGKTYSYVIANFEIKEEEKQFVQVWIQIKNRSHDAINLKFGYFQLLGDDMPAKILLGAGYDTWAFLAQDEEERKKINDTNIVIKPNNECNITFVWGSEKSDAVYKIVHSSGKSILLSKTEKK
jgi:hypothetical protein